MSVDFAALAEAVAAGLPDVRACLIVSRDGLVLAAHPAAEESRALVAWGRVGAMGDVERGFAVVGGEMWTFCRRGPYSALAIADPAARAGVILDRLEQSVLLAEEDRIRRESLRQRLEREAQPQEPVRRLRTPLHRDSKPEPEVIQAASDEPPVARGATPVGEDDHEDHVKDHDHEQQAGVEENPWSVDAIALAREFHGLVD